MHLTGFALHLTLREAAGLINDAALARLEAAFEPAGTQKYEMREE